MMRLLAFEFGKIVKRRIVGVGILALAVLGVILYTGSGPRGEAVRLPNGRYVTGGEAVAYNRQIAERYEGVLTEETVRAALEEFAPGAPDGGFWVINTTYNTMMNYWGEMDGSYNGLGVREAFPSYTDERELVYGYNKGYVGYLFTGSSLMIGIGFLIIIALSPVFSEEYDRRMDALILTSRWGKRQCALAKAAASYLFTLLAAGLALLLLTLVFLRDYGLSGGEASIQLNIGRYFNQVPYFLTSIQAAGYSLLLWLAGALALTGLVLVLSSVFRSAFLTVIVSLACYMIPMLMLELGIPRVCLALMPIWDFVAEPVLEIPKLPIGSSGFSYVWLVLGFGLAVTGASVVLGKRIFARHQAV